MNFIKSVRFSVLSLIILITGTCAPVMAATPSQIEEAKQKGVAWLATQQHPNGWWLDVGCYAGPTGLSLIVLEERAFELGYTPFDSDYPYKENVENGLFSLFSQMDIIDISTQPAADTDGDGKGVWVNYIVHRSTYETGIAMMAIAASRAPNKVVDAPGYPVDGWTYKDVLVDMVDYMAFGQNDSGNGQGGWGYFHNYGSSENSNSGYAVSGLGFAESPRFGFNCTIPQFVKDELTIWIDYIQADGGDNDGGSGYRIPYDDGNLLVNILKTGNLVFQMTFAGIDPQDDDFQRALAYIGRKWNDPSGDPGWGNPETPRCQAVYCTSNGLWFSNINSIIVDDNQKDWYADFAHALVIAQEVDGSWPTEEYGGQILATDWALLTLWKTAGRSLDIQDYEDTLFSGSFNSTLFDLRVTEDPGGAITSFSADSTDFGVSGNIWELEVFNDELYMCIGDTLYNPDVTVVGEDVTVTLGVPIWTVPDGDDITSMLSTDSMLLIGTGIEASTNSSYDSHTGDIYTYNGSIFERDDVLGTGVQCLILADVTCEPEHLTMAVRAYAEHSTAPGGWADAANKCVSPEDFAADEIKYVITITPGGQTDAQGLVLTVMLPDNVDFVEVEADDCGAYDENSHGVIWLLDDIASDANPVICTLIVKVNNSSVPDQSIITVHGLENDNFQIIANDNTPTVCCWGEGKLYVDQGNTGLQNGRSWETALTSLSSALNYATDSDCYSEIWVAAGTHIPQGTGPAETFIIPDGISIYGGFAGTEKALNERDFRSTSNETVLSGEGVHDYVVTVEGVSTIDGFSIQGGLIAGVRSDSSSPTISHCWIGYNGIGTAGNAGIHLSGTSTGVILNCVIYSNSGDGIYIDDTSSPFIRNNTIANNSLYGITNNGSGTPSIYNCLFWGNNSDGQQLDCTTYYCYIQGSTYTKANKDSNFNFGGANPFDPDREYHLLWDVDCINEGLNELEPVWTIDNGETDIDGEARIVGGMVDIGADESPPIWVDAGDTIYEEIPVGASSLDVDFSSAEIKSNGGAPVPVNLSYQWSCIYYPDGNEPVFVSGTDSELYASATFISEGWYQFLLEVMDPDNGYTVVGADLLWVRIDMGVEIVVVGKDPVSGVSGEKSYEAYINEILDLSAIFGPPSGPDHVEWWAPFIPVTIGEPTEVSTDISFDTPGRYPLELYALNSNYEAIGQDRVWIEVQNPQIEVSAGPDRVLYLEKNELEIWEVSDEFHGSVVGHITSADRVKWSVEAADDNADLDTVSVVCSSPEVANITFGHYGVYYVLFEAWKNTSLGEVSLGTGVAVTVVTYQQVELYAGDYPETPDVSVNCGEPATFNLQGEVIQGQVDSYEWVFTDPEAPDGLVTFTSPQSLGTMVSFNAIGGYSGAGTYPITLLGKIHVDGEDLIVGANTVEITVEVTGSCGGDFTQAICITTENDAVSPTLPLTVNVWAEIEEDSCGSGIIFVDYDYAAWSWSGTDNSVIISQSDLSAPVAEVTFNRAGAYILTLVVKNGGDLVATTSHPITIDRCAITAEAGFDTGRTVKVLEDIAIGDTNDLYGQVLNDCIDTQIDHYWSYEGSSDAVDLSPVDTELPIVQATATFTEPGDYPITLCAVNAQTRELLAHETILARVAPPLFWLDVSGPRITAPQAFPVDLPLTATILGGAPAGSTCYWSNAEPGGIPPDLSQPVAHGTTVTYSFSSAGRYELSVTGNVSDPAWSQTATATVFVTEEITEVVWNAGNTVYVTLPKTAHMSEAVFVSNNPNYVPKWSLDSGPADVTFLPNENSEKPYVMFSEEGHYTLSLVPWDLQTQAQLIDSEASIVDVFVYMPIVQNPDSPEVTLEKTDGSSNNLKILTATANDKDGVERLLMKLGDELLADASGYPTYYQDLELEYELDISHLPVGTSYFQAYAWDRANNLGQSNEIACENNSAIRDFQVDPETINNTSGDYLIFTASFDGDPRDWTLDIFKADGSSVDSYTGEDDLKLEDGLPPVHTVDWSNGNYSATLTVTDTGDTGEVHFRILRGQVYSSQVIADLNSIVGEKSGENILKADYDVEEFYGGIGFESPLPVIKDRYCEVFATLGNADFPEDVKYRLSVGTIASSGIYSYFTPIQVITPSDVPRDEAGWAPKFSKGDAKMSLGTVDLSMLENGNYYLELSVSCNDAENSDYAQFILNCPLKIGNVKFSQEDLVIETGGIPLRVVRSYDSFRKHKDSEFGYGWTYSIANMEIELDENRTIMYETDFDLFQIGDEMSVRFGGNLTQRNVTLTLPDGRRTTFMFYLEDAGKHGDLLPLYAAKYEAMPGIDASLRTLQEELLAVGLFKNHYWQGVAEGQVGGVFIDPAQYDFSGYVLTTADGTEYYFEREDLTNGPEFFTYEWIGIYYTVVRGPLYLTRIKTVDGEEILLNTDLVSGKIGFNGSGIECKDAQGNVTKSLQIEYYPVGTSNEGRIWYINAPSEVDQHPDTGTPTLVYEYDDEGNLEYVKKLVNKNGTTEDEKYDITEYVYYYGHWITDIIDERGLTPIRYFYDPAGRLTEVVDARGNHIIIEHDMAGNAEIVYERWDTEQRYPTTYAYNERGNVTLVQKNEVDEPGFLEKTEYFYDPDSAYPDSPREVRKFLPDDPGNPIVTQYDYDEDGKPLLIVDPENNVTETVYYDDGNVEWVIQGKNFTGTVGLPPYAYDIVSKTYNTYEGNKLKTMEACDAAGTRLQMTVNIYDGRNRLVNTVQIDVQVMAPVDFQALYNLQDITNLPYSNKHTITTYSYSGNDLQPLYITNSAGSSTYFSYDENGNQRASWYYWDDTSNNDYISIPKVIGYDSCVITLSDLDAQGHTIRTRRVVQAIANDANPPDPDIDTLLAESDGEVLSEMKYNSLGKADFTIDQYNNVTKYEYDQIGNQVETRTFSTTAYDIGLNNDGQFVKYIYDPGPPETTTEEPYASFGAFEVDADTSHLTTSQTLYDTEGRSLLTVGPYDPATSERPVGTETVYDVLGRVTEICRWAAVTVDLAPFKVVSGQSVLCEPDDMDMAGKMIPLGVYPEHAWDGTGTQPTSIGWKSEDQLPVVALSIGGGQIGPLSYSRTLYDSGGRVQHSVTLDEYGYENVTTYFYDKAGKQVELIGPEGHYIEGHPNNDLYIPGIALNNSAVSNATKINFDSFDYHVYEQGIQDNGNFTGTHKTVTSYDGTQRSSVTDARDNTTSFQYDALGRLEKTTHPVADYHDGTYQTFTYIGYDGLGRKEWQTEPTANAGPFGDADGQRWFDYDVAGRLTQVTMPKPTVTDLNPVYQYIYDERGNQVGILDPLDPSRLTVFEYDELNHQTAKYMPFVPGTALPADPNAAEVYGALQTALGLTEPPKAEYRDYDLQGRLEAHTDYEEQTTGYFYNNLGQLWYKRYYNSYSDYQSNPEGAWAEQIKYTYDALGRRTTVEEKDNNPNTYTRTTTYHYDAQGRIVQVDTDTPQGTINYTYDPITGRKTNTSTDSGNTNTNYYYDKLGRLAGTGTASENTYYHYDEVGNRKWQCIDADGGFDNSDPAAPTGYEIKTDYTYDPLNRLTDLLQQKTGEVGLSSYNYTLKADGHRHDLDETLNEARNITYGYDDLNRLTSETADSSGDGFTSTYQYDLAGNRIQRQVTANSQVLTTGYDYYLDTDKLHTETHTGPVYTVYPRENDRYYAYAAPNGGYFYRDTQGHTIGGLLAFFMGLPSIWSRYLFVLVMALVPVLLFGPGLLRLAKRYVLRHPIKVRLRVPRKGICLLVAFIMLLGPELFHSLSQAEVQYANLNTASWANGDTTITYTYDANGSVETKTTEVTSTSQVKEVVTYHYNLAGRLDKVTTDDQTATEYVAEYIYNDKGIRVQAYSYDQPTGGGAKSNEKTVIYLVDSYNHTGYAQVLEEWAEEGSTAVLTCYTLGDDVIAQTKSYWQWVVSQWELQSTDDTQYLLYDGHGSTRQLAEYDTDVTIVDDFSYDGYGVLLQDESVASANPGKSPAQATSLLYAGEQFDTDLQQYYNRARWYNPLTGLFNRMDPFAGNNQDPQSLHKYLYAHCNPINSIDPSGNFDFSLSGLMTTMSNIGMIMSITAPVWVPLASEAVWYLIPAEYRRKIENIMPDGLLLGGSLNVGGMVRSIPLDASVSLEGIFSPWTRKGAAYASFNIGYAFGGGAHAGASIYAGFVWANNSSIYRGPYGSISFSFTAVPKNVRRRIFRVLTRITSNIIVSDYASHAKGNINLEILRLIQQKDSAISELANSARTSLTFTVSWWYRGAVAISVGKGVSVGNTGKAIRIGFGGTVELWPNESGGTKFR